MNLLFGVPALAGPGRLKAGHHTDGTTQTGSWSQCTVSKSWGLSMNTQARPLPGGEQTFVGVWKVPLLGGVRGGFMVPMHAKKRKRALHEPPVGSSGFSRSRPPEGGTPCRRYDPDGFMVPMHAQKRNGALREPQFRPRR